MAERTKASRSRDTGLSPSSGPEDVAPFGTPVRCAQRQGGADSGQTDRAKKSANWNPGSPLQWMNFKLLKDRPHLLLHHYQLSTSSLPNWSRHSINIC